MLIDSKCYIEAIAYNVPGVCDVCQSEVKANVPKAERLTGREAHTLCCAKFARFHTNDYFFIAVPLKKV